jgi:transposase-like protein
MKCPACEASDSVVEHEAPRTITSLRSEIVYASKFLKCNVCGFDFVDEPLARTNDQALTIARQTLRASK